MGALRPLAAVAFGTATAVAVLRRTGPAALNRDVLKMPASRAAQSSSIHARMPSGAAAFLEFMSAHFT